MDLRAAESACSSRVRKIGRRPATLLGVGTSKLAADLWADSMYAVGVSAPEGTYEPVVEILCLMLGRVAESEW